MVKKSTKKDETKVEKSEVQETSSQPKQKAIQLNPQEAYKLFQDEQKKLQQLEKQLNDLEESIFDIDKTIFALQELNGAKEKEKFVNLGTGIFVKAKLEDTKKVSVNTGKIFLTRTPDEVLADFKKKKENMLNNLRKTTQVLNQTKQNVSQLYQYLSKMQEKAKEPKA